MDGDYVPIITPDDEDDVNVKYSYDSRKKWQQYVYLIKITSAIGIWYLSSIMATVVNKTLISGNQHVFPLTLTFAHVFISSVCDMVNMIAFHRRELKFYLKDMNLWMILRYVCPLAIAMVSTKLLTYISYGYIPASLTHTVKALQPFFNVLIVYLWTGEGVEKRTIFSLFPIVIGVVYASVNELEFNMVGFACALVSTIVGVWQSVYLKMLMRMGMEKNFIHWCNGCISCLLLLPPILFYEYWAGSYKNMNIRDLLLSSFVQYSSSISSYYTMSLLTSLSYSICSTFKRVSIILSSVFYFKKHLSLSNYAGILVASCGAVYYNIITKQMKRRRRSPQLKANRQLSYTDFNTLSI